MKLYFAYGANLNVPSMRSRCPDAVQIQPFHLRNWQLAFSGVATIRPRSGAFVAGALWAISDVDERNLDTFEGWPWLYRKEIICSDGLEFMVYVMNSDQPGEPSPWYVETIAQGYQHWGLDLQDLTDAIHNTQLEIAHDLHRSTGDHAYDHGNHGSVESDLYMESGHDLRWLRDHGLAHRRVGSLE